MKIIKKVLAFALTFILMSSVTVNAAPEFTAQTKADFKMSVTGRLKQLCVSNNSYIDDRGLIYSLMSLCNCSMWLSLAEDTHDTGFGGTELDTYYDYLTKTVTRFNDSYKSTSDDLSRTCQLNLPDFNGGRSTSINKFRLDVFNNLVDVCTYEYDKLSDAYSKLTTDTDKQEFLAEQSNHAVIMAVYRSCTRVEEEKSDILSLISISQATENRSFNFNIDNLTSIISNSKYADLVAYARKVLENEIAAMDDDDEMDGESAYARYLSDYDGHNQVNSHWLKAFACSSVYIPFESKLGDKEFIESLKYLDSSDKTEETYKKVYKYKKPLYFRKYTDDEKGTGSAKKYSVQGLINDIEKENSGVLVTIKGAFGKSQDSDMFAYNQDKGTQVYDDNGEVVNQGNDKDKNQDDDKDDNKDGDKDKDDNKDKDKDKNSDGSSDSKNEALDKENSQEILDNDTISDESIMSSTIFSFGTESPRATMNQMMMYNFIKDNKAVESFDNLDARYLYVNPFGDIVLDDDTVIIPGASNASYYKNDKGICYNPNTAAFMNSYPKISLDSEYFQSDERDEEKYIVAMEYKGNVENGAVGDNDNFDQSAVGPIETCDVESTAYIIAGDGKGVKFNQVGNNAMPIELNMFNNGQAKISTMKGINYRYKFGFSSFGSSTRASTQYFCMVVPDTSTLITYTNQSSIFPLSRPDSSNEDSVTDSDFMDKCKTLVGQFYNSMAYDKSGELVYLNARYDRQQLTDIFKVGYDGITNIAVFVKGAKDTYDAENADHWFRNTFKGIAQFLLDTLGKNTGVIGIQNAYQDKIFGSILNIAKQSIAVIVALIALFFIVKFARRSVNVIYGLVGTIVAISLTYLAIMVIPVLLPKTLNFCINNTSDDIAYKSLFMQLEKYENPFSEKSSYDSIGNFTLGTSSINLYSLTDAQITELCNECKINRDELVSGKSFTIDENSGLYAQGDTISINLDRLFAGLSIVGGQDTSSFTGYYGWTSKKYYSTQLDYYCPYYQMVDAFINKLNKTSALFNIPSSQLSYANGQHKDSFIVSAYTKSDLVLNNDKLEYLKNSCGESVYNRATESTFFGQNNLDLVGLRDILVTQVTSDFDSVKDTLWFKTMVRQGYYDSEGNIADEEKLAKLIEKVNVNVRKFLLDNRGQMAFISDENLIKGTCLYELTIFNQEISYFDDVVYPQSLNYEQLKLEDVLLPILTKDYDRFIAKEQKLVDYINEDFGVVGLILFGVICVESFIITTIMKYSVPVMYTLLLIILIARLALRGTERIKDVLKGYLKVFGSIAGSYFLFCVVTSKGCSMFSSVVALVILTIFYAILLILMATVIYALITNLVDFGNSKVNLVMSKAVSRLFRKLHLSNMVNQAREAIQHITPWKNKINSEKYIKRRYKRYSYDESFDDYYGDDIYDRVMHKRYDDYQPRTTKKYSSTNKNTKKHKITYAYDEDNDDNDFIKSSSSKERFKY